MILLVVFIPRESLLLAASSWKTMLEILVAASNQTAQQLQSDESRLGVTEKNPTRLIFTFLCLLHLFLSPLVIPSRAKGEVRASLKKNVFKLELSKPETMATTTKN